MLTPIGFSLLRQLSDGAFHSGEDLAAKVGLTRARVSQVLKQAETAGLALERIRGRGYRVTPQVEVNGRRIDLVVTGGSSKLAVECDGDAWHSTPDAAP